MTGKPEKTQAEREAEKALRRQQLRESKRRGALLPPQFRGWR